MVMNRYLVIGSGLIGRLLSWRLIQAGHEVDILSSDDRLGSDSAGYVAAAMIAPSTEAISAEPQVKVLGERSLALWPKWLEALPEPVFYQANGTLVVAHSGDKAELQRYQRRAQHVLGAQSYSHLTAATLAEREPELADNFDEAMCFEREACMDNKQLFQVLGRVLGQACDWQQCEPITRLSKMVIASLTQQYFSQLLETYDAVIDCRGTGAKQDLNQLRGVRGEIIRVRAPDVSLKHAIRLMHPRYPLYLAPRPNHEYVLGATVLESDDRSAISVRSGLELMSALYSLHKGFGEARVIEMAAHCRPALANNMPIIKRQSWGYQLNGFYRHGYLFGPAMIEECVNRLMGHTDQLQFEQYYDGEE